KAEKRIQKHGLTNCELYNMDAEALDFPDNSFDKIMVLYVLSVVPDPYKVMSEVRRVAKPGADVIFVNHFAKENPLVRRFESALSRWAAPLGFDPDFPMEPVLENVGLNVEKIESVNLFGYWTMLHGRCPEE
ncbi:MAG: class I SAM-dependent methyltransferase, partial [Pseudomonadota bacterium]